MEKGELIYKNGDSYQGQIKEGQLSGKGVYKFKNGSIYQGTFQHNAFWGKGKLKDAFNQITIIGQFQDNFAHGLVRVTHSDGSVYEGTLYRGLRQGRGTYHYPLLMEIKQKSYSGLFKDDMYEGHGELTFKDSAYYRGYFHKGLYEGNGQLSNKSFTYIGNFRQGNIEGEGSIKYYSGQIYEGQFLLNQKHGLGRYIYSDKTVYTGNWIKDKREGKGKLHFTDGSTFQGQFENNHYQGEGVYRFQTLIDKHKQLWETVAEFQQSQLNGPYKLRNLSRTVQLEGLYSKGIKNGLFLIQKICKGGKKVTYRGEFVSGKENAYTVSYSQRF